MQTKQPRLNIITALTLLSWIRICSLKHLISGSGFGIVYVNKHLPKNLDLASLHKSYPLSELTIVCVWGQRDQRGRPGADFIVGRHDLIRAPGHDGNDNKKLGQSRGRNYHRWVNNTRWVGGCESYPLMCLFYYKRQGEIDCSYLRNCAPDKMPYTTNYD